MANAYTDGTNLSNLLAAGYDRYLEYKLRSQIVWEQFVDKHPVDVTNPGPTVTLSIYQELAALATTPLSEDVDPDAVASVQPVRVTVTLNEYGNANLPTKRLKQLDFTRGVDAAIANVLGKNMIDTHDALVRTVAEGATNVLFKNAGVLKTGTGSTGAVANTDLLDSAMIRNAVGFLRRRNAHPRDMDDAYIGLIHPDVVVDIVNDAGWLAPHQYSDPANIYNQEVGRYLGARFIQTPRASEFLGVGSAGANVYNTTFLGAQALVKAEVEAPHVVIGPQVDKLRRFFPIGWYSHLGYSIFRQEAIQQVKTSAANSGL